MDYSAQLHYPGNIAKKIQRKRFAKPNGLFNMIITSPEVWTDRLIEYITLIERHLEPVVASDCWERPSASSPSSLRFASAAPELNRYKLMRVWNKSALLKM